MNPYRSPLDSSPIHSPAHLRLPAQRLSLLLTMTEKAGCTALSNELSQAGYYVHLAHNACETIALLDRLTVDVVLLHTDLPDVRASQLCQHIRRYSRVPLMVLTEQKNELELIESLGMGADVYVALPITFAELNARLQAILRRAGHANATCHRGSKRPLLNLDGRNRKIYIGEREIPLTQIEYRILHFLFYNANTPVTKEQLLADVWGYCEAHEVNFIEVAIWRLRHKIERDPSKPEYLTTVRGSGYQLNLTPG
ncbi:MAG: DNA-binding response regulator [Caldilinea sp. CFX5]|nr:DNA-binding response regulator [Caldilinea sp. CFX5]